MKTFQETRRGREQFRTGLHPLLTLDVPLAVKEAAKQKLGRMSKYCPTKATPGVRSLTTMTRRMGGSRNSGVLFTDASRGKVSTNSY